MVSKKEIRRELKRKRNEMDSALSIELSNQICEMIIKLVSNEKYQNYSKYLLYSSVNNEVDLTRLAQYLLDNKKNVYYPRVFGEEMDFFKINSFEDFEIGQFNILEPSEKLEKLTDDFSDSIMFVPGLAFSNEGQRIGYGKGYYDRYLSLHSKIITFGVGYDFQMHHLWQADEFDVLLNGYISEKREVVI